jgi:YHS domain-containing protein
MKKQTANLIAVICAFIFIACSAAPPLSRINVNAEGIAIKGYDPVAYFTMNKAVKGQNEFQFEWNSAKWLFANKEHLEMFQENPVKYAPRYGGY